MCLQDPVAAEALLLKQALKQRLSRPHRVLAATAEAEPSEAATGNEAVAGAQQTPQLTLQVMQRNASRTAGAAAAAAVPSLEQLLTSVIAPTAYGFTPVSQAYTCKLRPGAAVKCNIAITSSSMTEAYVPGADMYLVWSLNKPGQVNAGKAGSSMQPGAIESHATA